MVRRWDKRRGSGVIMREQKNCAPTFGDTARKALDKAICIIADGNAGYAAFAMMLVSWIGVMAVCACIW